MHCWLFFHRELSPGVPEAAEVYGFMEVARRMESSSTCYSRETSIS